jgi:hypothetical protein
MVIIIIIARQPLVPSRGFYLDCQLPVRIANCLSGLAIVFQDWRALVGRVAVASAPAFSLPPTRWRCVCPDGA